MKRKSQAMSPVKLRTAQRRRRSTFRAQRSTACLVPIQDAAPDLVRRFGEPEQLAILRVDDTFVGQKPDVDGATPILLAHQNDRNRLDLARLHESQDFEQL